MTEDVVLGIEEAFDDIDGKGNGDPLSRWIVIELADSMIKQPFFY